MRSTRGLGRAHGICLHGRPFLGSYSARGAHGGIDRQRSRENQSCWIPEIGGPQPLPGNPAQRGRGDQRESRAGDARRQGRARVRFADQRSACQLRGRTAQYSGGGLGWNVCRGFSTAGADERVVHRQDRGQFSAGQCRRRRACGAGFLLQRQESRILCKGSGPAGPATAGCA